MQTGRGGLKGQIFRVRGGVVWAPGNLSPSHTLTWLQQEMEGETGTQWSFCCPHDPSVPPWELRPLVVPSFPSSSLLCCISLCLVETFLGTMYHNQRGGSWGGEQEYFPLHLPTVDVHVVTRAAIMASLFCGHLTRVDQVWPGGHRSLSLDLLLQWSL